MSSLTTKITLRRMTVDFYGYIGQNYIFAYCNSKTSKLQKKNLKNSSIFCGPAAPLLLGGDILTNSCELIFCHNLVMLVPFCSYGDVLIVEKKRGGWGRENYGEGSKTTRKPINSIEIDFNRFKGESITTLTFFI